MRALDGISIWSGKAVSWLILPMCSVLVYEVVVRYIFNSPTIWAGDLSLLIYGGYFMLGAAYTLQRQMHIRTDFLYRNWTQRTQCLVDIALYVILYFPAMGMFMWLSWEFAFKSILQQEKIVTSPWMPVVYPLKITIPLATLLLLLQGVSEVLKSFYTMRTGIPLRAQDVDQET